MQKPAAVPKPKPGKPIAPSDNPSDANDEPTNDGEKPKKPSKAPKTPLPGDDGNPLNPVGRSLDELIQMQMNDDLWQAMMGDLSCLDATEECIKSLQEKAIENSLTLKQITERVADINSRIEEARSRNETSVKLGVLKPVVQYLVKEDTVTTPVINGTARTEKRGFLQKIFGFFTEPVGAINTILSLVGVPLLEGLTRSNDNAQARAIAISDLQVKVAQIEQEKQKAATLLREQVTLAVIDFDTIRREFQISQEIARREVLKLRIIEVDYRFGGNDTVGYLGSLSSLDKQKAQTFREWARMRSQLMRIKLLVLGTEGS